MSRPCETPGCTGTATAGTSEDGWRCEPCRERDRERQRAEDRYARCVHLEPDPRRWMVLYGTDEGRARWIESQWRLHEWAQLRVPVRNPETGRMTSMRQRTEKEARSAAAKAYARLRRSAAGSEAYEVRCARGHGCRACQRHLGCDFTAGGGIREHYGAVICDRQETCRDYRAAGDLVAQSCGMHQ